MLRGKTVFRVSSFTHDEKILIEFHGSLWQTVHLFNSETRRRYVPLVPFYTVTNNMRDRVHYWHRSQLKLHN